MATGALSLAAHHGGRGRRPRPETVSVLLPRTAPTFRLRTSAGSVGQAARKAPFGETCAPYPLSMKLNGGGTGTVQNGSA